MHAVTPLHFPTLARTQGIIWEAPFGLCLGSGCLENLDCLGVAILAGGHECRLAILR